MAMTLDDIGRFFKVVGLGLGVLTPVLGAGYYLGTRDVEHLRDRVKQADELNDTLERAIASGACIEVEGVQRTRAARSLIAGLEGTRLAALKMRPDPNAESYSFNGIELSETTDGDLSLFFDDPKVADEFSALNLERLFINRTISHWGLAPRGDPRGTKALDDQILAYANHTLALQEYLRAKYAPLVRSARSQP